MAFANATIGPRHTHKKKKEKRRAISSSTKNKNTKKKGPIVVFANATIGPRPIVAYANATIGLAHKKKKKNEAILKTRG